MPYRDPAERIARVGQGFSKMLSMINPDQLTRYEQASKFQGDYNQQARMSTGFNPGPDAQTTFPDTSQGRVQSHAG